MRLYKNFPEAFNEIRRDLKEMGVSVNNTHMQDKQGSFPTYELTNYGYTVLEPRFEDLNPVQPWADAEWAERVMGIHGNDVNPGEAWKLRKDEHMNWEEYLHDGKFTYSYAERLALKTQVLAVIEELKRNRDSRQLFVSLWDPNQDIEVIGKLRVPCSLGWHFLFREDKLNITYFMRSCDFVTHYQNDIWMSLNLLHYVSQGANLPTGKFSHFINSFHVYQKDVKDVF